MAKNDWILPLILLAGGYIWYSRFGGEAVINDLLGGLKGGGSQINTGQNISGNVDAGQIQSQVQSMLQKMGVDMNVDNGSGQDISRTRQTNTGTGGKITQTQSHSQKSDVFYTIPRFGNL